jgi:23S rRNA (uracil1939-C5)-methyltransferase
LSLALASYFDRVVGLEGLQSLVAGAIENAKRNVIGNVEFAVVDLGDIKSLEKAVENLGVIDLVVLDPPRGGAADIMPWIAKSGASQVVYVSCHPSTMLRDAHVLEESGYKMLNLGVLDMFPHSSHIESISLFVK